MSDWASDLQQVIKLRENIEDDPSLIATVGADLVSLCHSDTWIVQQYAADALAIGAQEHPESVVELLDDIVEVVFDPAVSTPASLRTTVQTVSTAAPARSRDELVEYLATTTPEDRPDGATEILCRGLLNVAVESPALVVETVERLRTEFETGTGNTREAILQTHLALVDSHPTAVEPIVPNLLDVFENNEDKCRRLAADICCALAKDTDRGMTIVERLHEWVSTRTVDSDHIPPRYNLRGSLKKPSLTRNLSGGCIGVAMVVARIAEESPDGVAPHVDTIASAVATRPEKFNEQWLRAHLTRALAAVARQQPDACRSIADALHALLADEAHTVNYWAVEALRGLANEHPDLLSTSPLVDSIPDSTEIMRTTPTDLIIRGIDTGAVDATVVVESVVATLETTDGPRTSPLFDLLAEIAAVTPAAVTPVLPTVADWLTDGASGAAEVFPPMAKASPGAVGEHVSALVDALLTDPPLARNDIDDTLTTIATRQPSVLDDELSALLSIIDDEAAAVDSIASVLSVVATRSLTDNQTVCEYVLSKATAEAVSVRRTAVRILATFVTTDGPDRDRLVTVLTERLHDDDELTHDTALTALGDIVRDDPERGSELVQRLYERDTQEWQQAAASILEKWVLFGRGCPPADLQHWLADTIDGTEGRPPQALLSAAGYILADEASADHLETVIAERLKSPPVTEPCFDAVETARKERPAVLSDAAIATAIEAAVTADRQIPRACLDLVPTATGSFREPQQLVDILTHRLPEQATDLSVDIEPVVALCAHHGSALSVPVDPLCSVVEQQVKRELLIDRDYHCREIGRIVKIQDADDQLREKLVELVETSEGQRRVAALNAIASVASLWPAGIQPLTDTLREYIDADDDDVRAAALAALVYVGRENPDALEPLSTKLGPDFSDSELIATTRRGYEGISILLADGGHYNVGVFDLLLRGLRHTDSSVTEYSLEGLIALDDPRALYPLKRIRDGVPDWSTLPPAFRSEPSETEQGSQEMIPTPPEPELTAADALAVLDD